MKFRAGGFIVAYADRPGQSHGNIVGWGPTLKEAFTAIPDWPPDPSVCGVTYGQLVLLFGPVSETLYSALATGDVPRGFSNWDLHKGVACFGWEPEHLWEVDEL